jgi:hypothetical protein
MHLEDVITADIQVSQIVLTSEMSQGGETNSIILKLWLKYCNIIFFDAGWEISTQGECLATQVDALRHRLLLCDTGCDISTNFALSRSPSGDIKFDESD